MSIPVLWNCTKDAKGLGNKAELKFHPPCVPPCTRMLSTASAIARCPFSLLLAFLPNVRDGRLLQLAHAPLDVVPWCRRRGDTPQGLKTGHTGLTPGAMLSAAHGSPGCSQRVGQRCIQKVPSSRELDGGDGNEDGFRLSVGHTLHLGRKMSACDVQSTS